MLNKVSKRIKLQGGDRFAQCCNAVGFIVPPRMRPAVQIASKEARPKTSRSVPTSPERVPRWFEPRTTNPGFYRP